MIQNEKLRGKVLALPARQLLKALLISETFIHSLLPLTYSKKKTNLPNSLSPNHHNCLDVIGFTLILEVLSREGDG